jgi:tryptophanase
MGLIDKIVSKTKEPDYSLTKEELEFVLLALKRATFTGEQLETVFNIVIKLQNQYQKYN